MGGEIGPVSLRYNQLPAALRAQVDAKEGKAKKVRAERRPTEPGLPLRCTRPGCTWVSTTATEGELSRHADTHAGLMVAVRYEWRP